MGIPYPNVVFKFPGMKISFTDDSPRSTIGFSYPAEVIKLLHSWGMFPKEPFLPLTTTPELKRLIGEFIKLSRIYPTLTNPGDIIDRICFNILQEIVTSRPETQRKNRTSDIRIQEVELYFQHHYDEKIDMDAVADQFGFSHTSFYQNWKKIYHSTPHRYIEELRLREAAFRLLQSSQPLSVIAEELQFPGSSYFYRKFRKHFHTTPAEFRRNREHWQKVLSESFPEGRPV